MSVVDLRGEMELPQPARPLLSHCFAKVGVNSF